MKIIWHVIRDFPNYEINRLGHIRNKETKILLKPYDDGLGYLRVKLNGKNCRLHILVAKTFIPNPLNKKVVNHKKGNKKDCRASQLEWCTQKENIRHAWDYGLIRRKNG